MQRDQSIDIAKGIGILLMLMGHCPGLVWPLRNSIFSFHMPLFFILSGYFFRSKDMRQVVLGKGNLRLLKSYFVTSLTVIMLAFITGGGNYALSRSLGMLMSNGGWPSEILMGELPFIGPIWFLLALYWCKVFYSYMVLYCQKTLLWSFVISTIALVVGKYLFNLPLGILTGMCGLVFYAMGDYWHKGRFPYLKNRWFLAIGILVWLFCIWRGHLELATFDCSFYPISMFAAFIGTYITILIASKTPTRLKPIMLWIGRNTLLILCYHTLAYSIVPLFKNLIFTLFEIKLSTTFIWNIVLSILLPYLHINISNCLRKCSGTLIRE